MRRAADIAVTVVCGTALVVAVTVARAQALPDPTRPPPGMDKPAAAPDATDEAQAAAGLQTIIRRRDAKPAAVINGEYVVLGGKHGDARVVRIGEDSVTLKSVAGNETLKLAPGVDMAPSAAPADAVRKDKPGRPHK